MNRREFVTLGSAFALAGKAFCSEGNPDERYAKFQAEINQVRAEDFNAYKRAFTPDMSARFPALRRLEEAFDRVKREVRETVVTDSPVVWLVYNMGVVVKTPETCFSIDLMHRRAHELASHLDFALITHNHGDHYTEAFYAAMNGAGKTVVSNFLDNYGAKDYPRNGGYTREVKTFRIKDVEITTGYTDHNGYLRDFTTTYEVRSHGYTIYHTGDCSNLDKLDPSVCPDLWCVHPRCGLDPVAAYRKFRPRQTAVLHLNEMGHDVNRWRWTWGDGLSVKAAIEAAGGCAVVPVWGERLRTDVRCRKEASEESLGFWDKLFG